jgi:cytochrome-b5 reductase
MSFFGMEFDELFTTVSDFLHQYNVIVMILTMLALVPAAFYFLDEPPVKPLDKEKWIPLELHDVLQISHDVRRFRFRYPDQKMLLGLPVGQHISFKYSETDTGKDIIRSYTPTKDGYGYVDFVIKVYFANVHPKFPEGGKMSQHLENMKVGERLLMRGPKGNLDYKGKGKFLVKRSAKEEVPYSVKKIGMIAGGTGITPMLQIINAVLSDPKDTTEMWLIFANQTEDDILLRSDLEALPKDRFHLWYTLDRPPEEWAYSSGFIGTDMCRDHLPAKGSDTLLLVCGPPPMIKFACEPAFKELGFEENDWVSF